MLRSKLQTSGASPAVWKSSSFSCCSTSCHHSPSLKLPSGVESTPADAHQSPGLCACGRQSQCTGMGINAVLRQFRKSSHICFACLQSWVSCHLPFLFLTPRNQSVCAAWHSFCMYGLLCLFHQEEYIY